MDNKEAGTSVVEPPRRHEVRVDPGLLATIEQYSRTRRALEEAGNKDGLGMLDIGFAVTI